MSATELYKEIKIKTAELRDLDRQAQQFKRDGKYEEFRTKMDILSAKNNELTNWMREIIKARVTELCQLIRSKDWPPGVPRIMGHAQSPPIQRLLWH